MQAASAIARRTLADGRISTGSFALLFLFIAFVQPGRLSATPTRPRPTGWRSPELRHEQDRAAVLRRSARSSQRRRIHRLARRRHGLDLRRCLGADGGRPRPTRRGRCGPPGARARRRDQPPATPTWPRWQRSPAARSSCGWLCSSGLVAARLSVAGSAFLALAVVSPIPVFAGVGALASQIAPTKRLALALASAVLGLAFLLRVIADTSTGYGWMRWLTPLGWAEEMQAIR